VLHPWFLVFGGFFSGPDLYVVTHIYSIGCPTNPFEKGRKFRGGGDVSPQIFDWERCYVKYLPKFFTRCIMLFTYFNICFLIFNTKTTLLQRVLSYFDRYHRLSFMLISSKLSKLTSTMIQQPSLCMLLISFQFTKLLRHNHNIRFFLPPFWACHLRAKTKNLSLR